MTQLLKTVAKAVLRTAHQATAILDYPFLSQVRESRWPPIFILGTPRSGTSLLYQLICHAFKVAYIPNIANTFYMCPIFATMVGRKLCPAYRSQFTSRYGYEKGCLAPSEAGNIWNRWFPHEKREGFNYTPAGYLSESDRHHIHQLVTWYERFENAPFVAKNVKMGVRLPALREIFPEARFIWIRRNPVDAATSILRIRRQRKLSWWSVMPREKEQLRNLPDWEQVLLQVIYLEKDIEADLHLFPPEHFMQINYKELCLNPRGQLQRIADFLDDVLSGRRSSEDRLPSRFPVFHASPDRWVQASDIAAMEALLAERNPQLLRN